MEHLDTYNIIPSGLKGKFRLVSADMGYGHHRAIYPLKDLSFEGDILNANVAPDSTPKERRQWRTILHLYEFISRTGKLPVIGHYITQLLDKALYIPDFYPLKDRSKPTFQVKYLKKQIKKGLGRGITDKIKVPALPLITSFYLPAIAADMAGQEIIYCIICDTDLNRIWVSEEPEESRIIYFASGTVSQQRLLSYGAPEKNILLTGFPLPIELTGDRNLLTLKKNLTRRLLNLDPLRKFSNLYRHSIRVYLEEYNGSDMDQGKTPLIITYSVGGAGAQKETGLQIAESLAGKIKSGEVILNLVAGTKTDVRDYFNEVKHKIDKSENVRVIWARENELYFRLFNQCLHTTDILWTKPSELSFYSALGLPIIMTPAIGPQEKCNRRWLREIGAGIKQQNPEDTNQWLFDLLYKGRLAEAAWNGFLKGRKYGTFNILDFLATGTFASSNDPLRR
jgi:hypothetical protein